MNVLETTQLRANVTAGYLWRYLWRPSAKSRK